MNTKHIAAALVAAVALLAASCSSGRDFSKAFASLDGIESVVQVNIPGVVNVVTSEDSANDSIMMSCVDRLVESRGAEELLTVSEDGQDVTIYGTPDDSHPERIHKPIIVVHEGGRTVVVGLRSSLNLNDILNQAEKYYRNSTTE